MSSCFYIKNVTIFHQEVSLIFIENGYFKELISTAQLISEMTNIILERERWKYYLQL